MIKYHDQKTLAEEFVWAFGSKTAGGRWQERNLRDHIFIHKHE